LLDTDYGVRLLSKLAFVLVLLMVAALNRFLLTPALAARHAGAIPRLRASIGLEICLGLAILAATSSLGEVPTPRALAAASSLAPHAAFSLVTFADGDGALVEATPAAHGPNRIEIHLFGAGGTPLGAREIVIELSMPAAGIEASEHHLSALASGFYRWQGQLPLAGDWRVQIIVPVGDFDEIRFDTQLPVR